MSRMMSMAPKKGHRAACARTQQETLQIRAAYLDDAYESRKGVSGLTIVGIVTTRGSGKVVPFEEELCAKAQRHAIADAAGII